MKTFQKFEFLNLPPGEHTRLACLVRRLVEQIPWARGKIGAPPILDTRAACAPHFFNPLAVFWLICCASALEASPLISLDGTGSDAITIRVSPRNASSISLLEVLDTKGTCLKTVHAGGFSNGQKFSVGKNHGLKPGDYRIRYREGVTLALDAAVTLPHKERWVNPTDIAINSKGVYVLDRGIIEVPAVKSEDGTTTDAVPGLGSTYLYRFSRDGKPDTTFADRGRMTVDEAPTRVWSVAVDDEGIIYLPSQREHRVMVFSPTGDKTDQTIGGYEDNPNSNRNTTYISWIALGPGKRIYLFFGDLVRVYDRTKNAFDGFLYTGNSAYSKIVDGRSIGGNQITSDRQGAVYIASEAHQLEKLLDDGKAIKPSYSFHAAPMCSPMGPSAAGGLVWVATHGPATPYWDSGGAGEMVLFWDNGAELVRVEAYGKAGKAADKLEFINPCATAQTSDHLELWVAEDGVANPDGPPGNARVRKFHIASTRSEEAPLVIN